MTYHGSVYEELGARLSGAPNGDYLVQFADVIAASSRAIEPFLASWVKSTVRSLKPARMLEVGCGSGVYLLHAANAHPGVTGVGIDVQPSVVAAATQNLEHWGIGHRFVIHEGDVRAFEPKERFDLVTLYNNIYYFDPDERLDILVQLHALAPNGALAVVSMMRGKSVASADLDLTLQSTLGCFPLPACDELTEQLRRAGYSNVTRTPLFPGEPLLALLAR